MSVVDADATAAQAVALGAEVLVAPVDVGPPGSMAGRWAALSDPDGAPIRLWQPGYRHGAQLVNSPGSWNSSDLATTNADGAKAFYGAIFGWEADPVDFGGGDTDGDSFMWRLPGYGDFVAIRDPEIKRRHAEPWVPKGFSDAIGWMTAVADTPRPPALERHLHGQQHRRGGRTGGEARGNGGVTTLQQWRWAWFDRPPSRIHRAPCSPLAATTRRRCRS